MPTYTKETALYDTGAIKDGIDGAAETASKYLTVISGTTGISVHNENDNKNFVNMNAADGVTIYRNINGTATDVANFGDNARIGQSNKTHANVYSNSLELTDSAGTTFFKVRDAVNESGQVTDTFTGDGETTQFTLSYTASNTTYTVTQNGIAVSPTKTTTQIVFSTAPAVGDIIVVVYNVTGNSAKAYDLGIRKTNTISGSYSVIEGYETIASNSYSHAEGYITVASGSSSHAEGYNTKASGNCSHAEGSDTMARGGYSHAEGYYTNASGIYSHAEGLGTNAIGDYSHVEGSNCNAAYDCAHAEGLSTNAIGNYSHAQNRSTIAGYDCQTAIGKYNDNQSTNAFEVGNGTGTGTSRSNALTVDWNGNVDAQGGYTIGSKSLLKTKTVLIKDGIAVNANTYATENKNVNDETGYTPIGIVGVHLENATSGGTYNTFCYAHSFYISNGTAYFIFKNTHATTNAKIKASATILYANTGII